MAAMHHRLVCEGSHQKRLSSRVVILMAGVSKRGGLMEGD